MRLFILPFLLLTFSILVYSFVASGARSGEAPESVGPEEALSEATAVLQKQLSGLKNNDQPTQDAGIQTAWDFAHPSNREATGPLNRFTQMLKSPTYRGLLNHAAHEITVVSSSQTTATFDVLVYPGSNSAPQRYRWIVAVVQSGARAGSWATTAVSAPIQAGLPPV
jgi:hypothetical protein